MTLLAAVWRSEAVMWFRQSKRRGLGDVQGPAGGVPGGGQYVPDGQNAHLLQGRRAGAP